MGFGDWVGEEFENRKGDEGVLSGDCAEFKLFVLLLCRQPLCSRLPPVNVDACVCVGVCVAARRQLCDDACKSWALLTLMD